MTLTLGTGPLASGAPTATNYRFDGPEHQLLFTSFPRRIRAKLNGQIILDSEHAMLLHESDIFPLVYVPIADVATDLLTKTSHSTWCPYKGEASYWTITVEDRVAANAVWGYETPIDQAAWLRGYVSVDWGSMDHWLDEDDEIFGHIRDPYHRVDARPTSRRYQVFIGNDLVADTTAAFVVSETGGDNRIYIPPADIRTDLLTKSDTTTHCPHKGQSTYWHHHDSRSLDVAWSYEAPLDEATRVPGYRCFDGPTVRIERSAS